MLILSDHAEPIPKNSSSYSDSDCNLNMDDNTKPTMLLANDNIFLLKAYAKMISFYFRVFKAENGLEAYDILRDKPRHYFDAVVLDIHMPIMDGF